jgi:hypothetical protein
VQLARDALTQYRSDPNLKKEASAVDVWLSRNGGR